MLWDIYGQDDFQTVQASQLRGMSGYLLVVDGTRRATLETARQLQEKATDAVGPVPFILLLNKLDLAAQWEIDEPAFFKLVEARLARRPHQRQDRRRRRRGVRDCSRARCFADFVTRTR